MTESALDIPAIEAFARSFAVHALGLTLGERISADTAWPPASRSACTGVPMKTPAASCAWHTDRGVLAILAHYEEEQSAVVRAYVFRFEWWLGGFHHASWYHAYRSFPDEWIRGRGSSSR